MSAHKLNRVLLFQSRFDKRCAYYTKITGQLAASLHEWEEWAKKLGPIEDPEYGDALSDERWEITNDLLGSSELLLVDIYHWVERSLKLILHWYPWTKKPDINRMHARELRKAFKATGIVLSTLAGFSRMELLRDLANSWKHEPLDPSRELLRRLKLKSAGDGMGTLGRIAIEAALRRELRIPGPDETCFDLVRRAAEQARAYLMDVAQRMTFKG